jgi:NAD(P)H-hydrate repair Nnr-like enzyme with NAD(P)H-hydrate dehydratase domain
MTDDAAVRRLLERLVPRLGPDVVLVLDAGAITALAGAHHVLRPLGGRAVLTPTPERWPPCSGWSATA